MPRIERYVYKSWDEDDKGDNDDEARTYSQMGMLLGGPICYELLEDSDSDGEDGFGTKDCNAPNFKYMTVGANVAPNMEPIKKILAPAIDKYQSSVNPHRPFFDARIGNAKTPFGSVIDAPQVFASEDLKGLMDYFLGTSFSKDDKRLMAPGDGYALLEGSTDFKGNPYPDTRFKTPQDVLDMLSFVANENNALGDPSKPLNSAGWERQVKSYFKSLDKLCDEEHKKMKEDPVYKEIWSKATKTVKSKAYDIGDITPPKLEPGDDIRTDDEGYSFAAGSWYPQDPTDEIEITKLSQTYINKLPIMKKLGYPQEYTDYKELEKEDRIEMQKHFLKTIPAFKCARENMEDDDEDEKPGAAFLKILPAMQLIHECDLNRESMSGRRENITSIVEDMISAVFESVVEVIGDIIADLIGAIGYGINAVLKSIISVIVNTIATIANSINVAVTTVFGAVDDAIINAGIFIHDTLITIRTTASNIILEAGGLIDEAVDSTAEVAVSVIHAVSDPAVKLFNETGGTMVNAIDSAGDVANNVIDTTQDAANNIIDETGSTIMSGTTAVGDSIQNVFDTIPQAVEDSNFIPFIGETALAFRNTLKEWIPFMDPLVGKRETFYAHPLNAKKYYSGDYKPLPPIPNEEPVIEIDDSSTTLVHRMGIIIFILLVCLIYFATRPTNNSRRSTRYETYD